MFATSKNVHRTLIQIFDPWCKNHGFRRIGSAKCAYQRPLSSQPDRLLAFEVQCSSWGSALSGSMFTLNAGAGISDVSNVHHRILKMLESQALDDARAIADHVRQRHECLPQLSWAWASGNDQWCQYYDTEDVARWGNFIGLHVRVLLNQLLAMESLPPEAGLDH
ncbi:MAG: hypothetical protein V4739_16720 [Pseudomonadota bacterium]